MRVIAATNESLADAVQAGRFRADLFYRLNVFPVQIPPLRERLEDLPLLVEHFLQKFHQEYNKRTLGLSDKALQLCLKYHWPGNIRELENVIERGVILTDSNETVGQEALFAIHPACHNPCDEKKLDARGSLVESKDHQDPAAGDWVSRILQHCLVTSQCLVVFCTGLAGAIATVVPEPEGGAQVTETERNLGSVLILQGQRSRWARGMV